MSLKTIQKEEEKGTRLKEEIVQEEKIIGLMKKGYMNTE